MTTEAYPILNAGPETEVLPPLSQSKQGLMACPYLYVEREIRGVEDSDNEYKQRGTQIHNIMSRYIDHCVSIKKPSDFYHLDQLLEEGQLYEALEIVSRMKKSLVIDPDKVLGTEMYLALDKDHKAVVLEEKSKLEHRSEAGVEIEGTLDYVQLESAVSATIFDWKSLFAIIDCDTFQSKLYPYLLFKHYPFLEEVRFVLQFVRYNVARDVTYTREQLPELEREIRSERRRQLRLHDAHAKLELHGGDVELMQAEAQRLDACPGKHCAWCPKLMASIRANTIAQTVKISPAVDQSTVCPIAEINDWLQADPETMLKVGIFLQEIVGKLSSMLREHVKAGGKVEVMDANGTVYAAEYVDAKSDKFPALPAVEALKRWQEESGEDLLSKVYVGVTELRQPLNTKKRASLRETFDALKHTKSYAKWHIGKQGKAEEDEGSL